MRLLFPTRLLLAAVFLLAACTDEPAVAPAPGPLPLANAPTWDIDATLAADPDCVDPLVGDGLRIGYAANRSPRSGGSDEAGVAAVEHVVAQINCSGGIDGRPVSVEIADVTAEPGQASIATSELIDAGAQVLFASRFDDVAAEIAEAATGRVPILWLGTTDADLADVDRYTYLAGMSDLMQAEAVAEFSHLQGWRTAIGVQSAVSPSSDAKIASVLDVWSGLPGTSATRVTAVENDQQRMIVSSALGAADVVFSTLPTGDVIRMLQQLRLDGSGVAIVSLARGGGQLPGELNAMEGVFVADHAALEGNLRFGQLESSYRSRSSESFDQPWLAAIAVDALAVVADTVLRTGAVDAASLGPAIANANDVSAMTSTLSYEGTAIPNKEVFIHQVFGGQLLHAGSID